MGLHRAQQIMLTDLEEETESLSLPLPTLRALVNSNSACLRVQLSVHNIFGF